MDDRFHRKWRAIDLAASALLLLLIGGLAWAALYASTADAGMITAYATVARNNADSTTVTFRGPNDETVSVDLRALRPPQHVGGTLKVVYPSRQPTAARLPNPESVVPTLFALCGLVMLAGTLEAYFRRRTSLRLIARRDEARPIVIEARTRKAEGDVLYIWAESAGRPPNGSPGARVRADLARSGLSAGDVCDADLGGVLRRGRVVVIWVDGNEVRVNGRVKVLRQPGSVATDLQGGRPTPSSSG